ncbi:ral guanine nucleotide dissociation stimulator-like 1 isoform X2 [Dendroctonus ponderosae]|uniref:ral guanine nucleotide dissociation stimulator-like 1 isoform X2 n=1 Tax=Dendroctonus ponderosae TaxID=77166 RepID=UPI00203518C9|nr:ral guanine nucleotide dissociation stimulator-like 1 isoform X2 [Dendroctonus ponderosae]
MIHPPSAACAFKPASSSGQIVWYREMLLPTSNSNCPIGFQNDIYHEVAEKTKFLTLKCTGKQRTHNSHARSKSAERIKFRFCACTGPKKNKKSAKWYVKPTWRLWGEEKADGALYTVYLKKVRYHRPTRSVSSSHSDSDDEISHLEWETVRVRFVKAGTLKNLVEALSTDDGELETTYINVFLATYRSFSTAKEVLTLLLERYEELTQSAQNGRPEQHDQHKKTLISALHVWLDSYPEDFKDPPNYPALRLLLNFSEDYLPNTELDAKVRHRLDRYSREAHVDPLLAPPPAFAMRSIASSGWRNYKLPDVPVRHFAEQLTRMDVDLFKKLVPHQCLGAVWSRRDRSRSHEAATVLATVNQFNAVSFRVISSILVEPGLKTYDRACLIAGWIDIAQELRLIKNFSSLKAIISGLQSNPIYRLQKTWQAIAKEKIELFDELARIFSEDNNQWTQRELLMKEGTAKFADTVGENDKQLQKIFQRQNNHTANISFGTIPYLGTFLTDLTMIDTAIPDSIGDGLINFDKRRKEFEVLAQIKLLQGAANAYHFMEDPAFDRWFDSILVLDDREAYQLSCQIEPATNGQNRKDRSNKARGIPGHQKNDSITSTSSSNSSQFYCDVDSITSSPHNSIDRKMSPSQMSNSSSNSSLPSLDISLNSSHSGSATNRLQVPLSNNSGTLSNNSQKSSPDFYIIKVTYETDNPETEGIVLYKSIMLSNNERTPQVIRNAMYKLGLEGNPDQYTLAQVLPDKEMTLPSNANVYYAVNTAHNLNFILRSKPTDLTPTGKGLKGKSKS